MPDIVEHCVILLLHSKLPQVEQHKVFMSVPKGKRKVSCKIIYM